LSTSILSIASTQITPGGPCGSRARLFFHAGARKVGGVAGQHTGRARISTNSGDAVRSGRVPGWFCGHIRIAYICTFWPGSFEPRWPESEIASGLQVLLGCTEPTILEGPWDIAGSIRMLDDVVKTML